MIRNILLFIGLLGYHGSGLVFILAGAYLGYLFFLMVQDAWGYFVDPMLWRMQSWRH